MKKIVLVLFRSLWLLLICYSTPSVAQYSLSVHKKPEGKVVPVTGPGSYAVPGTTYMLVNDISAPMTAVFLGKDVTLDLNGYTIRFADGNYDHISNSGFEEGERGWDLSKAPGAKVVNTEEVHVFIGKKIMSLKKGDEITSPYVNLSIASRSYFAMCGVTGSDYRDMRGDLKNQMKVSIYVEDENGSEIRTVTSYGDTTMRSCPVENRSPRLGGGFVYAHLHNLPAGKYRVRVKAETDCLIDDVDIRPSLDAGIAIVEKTYPQVHYDHLYEGTVSAFFDYTKDAAKGLPLDSIPAVKGGGTVVIRNGIIENGAEGIVSWGIQSTAEKVKVVLDNVRIVTSGINTIAADLPQATITNCRFEVNNPFIINRHNANFYAVDLSGEEASEVSFSEFFGGQGCLVFKGKKTSVHHNYFVNKQMVTNHYSIMAMGDSSRIFQNRIEPEVGSGIEIYVHKYIEIFNNLIRIKTSPPTCEYGHEEYSTAAIRMADYRAKPGALNGCYGNKVYNNKIYVAATPQPGVDTYAPMAWAIYYSASGGDNEIFGNEIFVNKPEMNSKVVAAAFYICGGPEGFGGNFYDNTIITNVPAAWIGTMYGGAANSKIYHNTIIKSPDAPATFKPFRMGSSQGPQLVAKNIEFRSNEFRDCFFDIERTDQAHSYSVYWKLGIKVVDKAGRPLSKVRVLIKDKNENTRYSGQTDLHGNLHAELPEYTVNGSETVLSSPYKVLAGKAQKEIILKENSNLTVTMKR
ncbi:MAG: hypothetical protein WEB30_08405 [Cyclobacteriaceae bacterium]